MQSEYSTRPARRIPQAWAAPGTRCETQHARPAAGGAQPHGGVSVTADVHEMTLVEAAGSLAIQGHRRS